MPTGWIPTRSRGGSCACNVDRAIGHNWPMSTYPNQEPEVWPTAPPVAEPVSEVPGPLWAAAPGSGLVDRHAADETSDAFAPIPDSVTSSHLWSQGRRMAKFYLVMTMLFIVVGFLMQVMVLTVLHGHATAWQTFAPLLMAFPAALIFALLSQNYWTISKIDVTADSEGIRATSAISHWSIAWSQIASISVHDPLPGHIWSGRVTITPKPGEKYPHRMTVLIRQLGARGAIGAPLEAHAIPVIRRMAARHGLDATPHTP